MFRNAVSGNGISEFEFLRVRYEDVIIGPDNMFKKRKAELYAENRKPVSIDELNTDMDQSLEDAANDNINSAKDLRAEIKK